MTRRERLENKLEKRQEWAGKATARSDRAFAATNKLADAIPLGQPILVGHHSERHARADAARIDNGMRKSVEEMHLAEHHAQKASGIAQQLDRTIFSDDDNATAALQARIDEREAKAASMVALNKAWRASKGDVATFAAKANITEEQAAQLASRIATAYSWEKQPYPAWELSNLRNLIRADKQRIEDIKAQQSRTEQAEAAGGVVVEGEAYVRVTFAEKPERSTIDALKAAGFRWGSGSWYGERAKLPTI